MENSETVMPCKVSDLQLRQHVRLCEGPYGWGVVCKITESHVYVQRPYMHTSDFSAGSTRDGGTHYVIDYIGTETVSLWKGDSRAVMVSLDRVHPPK
jgi:hypothetical protein